MTQVFPEPRPSVALRMRQLAALADNSLYDACRFWRASFTNGAQNRENLRARIAISLHFLEYGLSLRDAEPGRGADRAAQLATDIDTYIVQFGPDASTEIALRALEGWLSANVGASCNTGLARRVVAAHANAPDTGLKGGREKVSREEIQARSMMDFLSFAQSRHSIRTYAAEPVPLQAIERAVQAAQQSPSSCNRQTCRAHVWTDPVACARILSLQSGNRGFGDQLGGVAVITSDLAHWEQANERYQGWIDGGMFAMSFAYALHAEGLGAVMLNWSERKERDRELRAVAGLAESELVITMIGFGCLPARLNVPVSQRKPLSYALRLNTPLGAR